MAVTSLTNRRVLSDAKFMYLTPWTSESAIGTTTYDITDIVADTITIEQEDNNVNAKESEFTDAPLFENIDLGKFNFGATCIDLQNDIMQAIYGWTPDSNTTGDKAVFAPKSYKPIYATIVVGFDNAVVCAPKVRLDSRAVISTLKTGSAESQIGGTCYNAYVKFTATGAVATETPLAIISVATEEAAKTMAEGITVTATDPTTTD